tara:strand:+ start:505 stop:612 length:108 start_codon:yes stop_codon:yes gene_type:complete
MYLNAYLLLKTFANERKVLAHTLFFTVPPELLGNV